MRSLFSPVISFVCPSANSHLKESPTSGVSCYNILHALVLSKISPRFKSNGLLSKCLPWKLLNYPLLPALPCHRQFTGALARTCPLALKRAHSGLCWGACLLELAFISLNVASVRFQMLGYNTRILANRVQWLRVIYYFKTVTLFARD